MRDFNTKDEAYSDFCRLVHGIESNRRTLREVAGKTPSPSGYQENLEAVITVQEGVLAEMARRNGGAPASGR